MSDPGHYGVDYYATHFPSRLEFGRRWQAERYFRPHCHDQATILDFGCGRGSHLRHLLARRKIGVEISPVCREAITRDNATLPPPPIELMALPDIPAGSVDLVISNHALEHVPDPHHTLVQLRRVLTVGGQLILVTPFDDIRNRHNRRWVDEDLDWHLYTWSPKNMVRLLETVDFHVLSCRVIATRCSPKLYWVHRWFGALAFRQACDLLGLLQNRFEVATVAYK